MRRWLPAAAFDHPVTVMMAVLALLVVGGIAWKRISLQLMPSGFEAPNLSVWISYPNATPVETDEKIVAPMAAQLATIPGLSDVMSRAQADGAFFRLTFHKSSDVDESYNAVSDRLDRAMLDMPADVERGYIWKFDMDDAPFLFLGITLPDDVDDPYYILERVLKPKVERIEGVARVNVWGVPQRSIHIDYDRDKIVAHGINLGEVQGRLGRDNFQMAAGQLTANNQNQLVRSLSMFEDLDTLKQYPVKDELVLEDLAELTYRTGRAASINRLNSQSVAVLAVAKESGANTVQVASEVRSSLEEMLKDPRLKGADYVPFFDQGELVMESLDNLVNAALIGGVFAIVVLFLFLREWRMTLLISLSIPFSVLISIGALYFKGDSLNLLSLMGLMLAVGMVVDNAIVVVETIYRRRAEGADTREAAISGSAEVNLAIVLSTATTMVVFLPLILMSGEAEISFFTGVLGMPVIFALLASLFVALVFAPLATRYIKGASIKEDPRWMKWLMARYRGALKWGLSRRYDGTMVIFVVAALTFAIPLQSVECTPMDENSKKEFSINFVIHPQAGYSEREELVSRLEGLVEEHKARWGVKAYYAELDSDSDWGRIEVFLENDAPMLRADIIDEARDLLPDDMPGVYTQIGWGGGERSGNKAYFEIYGEDMETLVELGDEAVRRLQAMPQVVGARRDVVNGGAEELHVALNREALLRYGLSAQTVGGTIAYYLRGTQLTPLLKDGRETTIMTRFEIDDRGDMNALMQSPIWSPATMRLVSLETMADVRFERAPHSIGRKNGITSVSVSVDLDKDVKKMGGQAVLATALKDMVFPRGYSWDASEMYRNFESDQGEQLTLILMSVVFVFLLMGILFESWLLPLSVITTVPMAVMGAFWLLWILETPFDTMAAIGLVILVGVVVNNGIVLIDLIRQLREEGMDRMEAILLAGENRFRPIMMTALTTIFGLVPMAMGNGEFVGLSYAPLGRTVIGGLIAATLLTLVFVPFLYAWLDDLRNTFTQVFRFAIGAK